MLLSKFIACAALAVGLSILSLVLPLMFAPGHWFWSPIVWPMPQLFLGRMVVLTIVLFAAQRACIGVARGRSLWFLMALGYAVGAGHMAYYYWLSARFYGRLWGPEFDPAIDALLFVASPPGIWAGLSGAFAGWGIQAICSRWAISRSVSG